MSDEAQPPEITDGVKHLLQAIGAHAFPPPEDTFFSITGRGRLENPITDLLCYFMRPKAPHGLKESFLRAFLECMKVDCGPLDLAEANVTPQVQTNDGKWIDLLVIGPDWVLVIENKIRAKLYNPLVSYETHAKQLSKKQCFLAILSPEPFDVEDWQSVTYREYCDALRRNLPPLKSHEGKSKWQVLASEFILHLQNEVSNSTMIMNPEQITFVEENLLQFGQLDKLSKSYTNHLFDEVKNALQTLPKLQLKSENWAFTCSETNAGPDRWCFCLQIPTHVSCPPGANFVISVWLRDDIRHTGNSQVKDAISGMQYHSSEAGGDWLNIKFDDRTAAINKICDIAKHLHAFSTPEQVA